MTSSFPSARSVAPLPTPATTTGPPGTAGQVRPPGPSQPEASSLLARIGVWCYDHRKAAVGMWFAALVVVLAAAGAYRRRL